jgi:hypothetical protein
MDDRILYAVGGVVAGALAGGGGVYLYMQRQFEKEFTKELQAAVEAEVAATKKFYSAIQKSDYPTPGDLAAEVAEKNPGFVLDEEKLAEAKDLIEENQYGETEGLVPVARNVFTDFADNSTWDPDAEEAQRDPAVPYVISADEFFENAPDYIQDQVTYFAGDGVLADTSDKPLDDSVVGEDNLRKFGHGSKDPNVVYVRNEPMGLDLEVSYAEGTYAEQVHGFIKHNDDVHRSARTRKFRLEDE